MASIESLEKRIDVLERQVGRDRWEPHNICGVTLADAMVECNVLDLREMAPPTTPSTDNLRFYAESIHGFAFPSFRDETGMIRKLVRDSVFVAQNDTGATIAAGRIVYATGSADNVPTIALAKADSVSTMPAIGVTVERLLDDAYGRVMQVGLLESVNTSTFAAGDVLYVSEATAGIPTKTIPVGTNIPQEIGTVLVSDADEGTIQIVARSMQYRGVVRVDRDGDGDFDPYTGASWDGDSFSTSTGTIDWNTDFGVPDDAKMVFVSVSCRDLASAGGNYSIMLYGKSTTTNPSFTLRAPRAVDDIKGEGSGWVPVASAGTSYYSISASGAGTFGVWITVVAYTR